MTAFKFILWWQRLHHNCFTVEPKKIKEKLLGLIKLFRRWGLVSSCPQKHRNNLVQHSPFDTLNLSPQNQLSQLCLCLPRTWNSNGVSTAWVNPSNQAADAFGQIRNWNGDWANISTQSISLSSVQIWGAKSSSKSKYVPNIKRILWEQATCLVSVYLSWYLRAWC